jgi:hypothetical protein
VDCGRTDRRERGLTGFDPPVSYPPAGSEASAHAIIWESDIGAANVDD